MKKLFTRSIVALLFMTILVPGGSTAANAADTPLDCNTQGSVPVSQVARLSDPACDYKNVSIDTGCSLGLAVPRLGKAAELSTFTAPDKPNVQAVITRTPAGKVAASVNNEVFGAPEAKQYVAPAASSGDPNTTWLGPEYRTYPYKRAEGVSYGGYFNGWAYPLQCGNASNSFGNARWADLSGFKWYYNPANEPDKNAVKSIRGAVNSWVPDANNASTRELDISTDGNYVSVCGTKVTLPKNMRTSYQGTTNTQPNLFNDFRACDEANSDGKNVIGWSPRGYRNGEGYFGATCIFYSDSTRTKIVEADQVFAVDISKWEIATRRDQPLPPNCGADLWSVAMHEMGHSLGFGNLTAATDQVMAAGGGFAREEPCGEPVGRALGKGDAIGMLKKYGGSVAGLQKDWPGVTVTNPWWNR